MNGILDQAIFCYPRWRKFQAMRIFCISLMALMAGRAQVRAADVSWIAASGYYETNSNWSTATVPTSADRAIFGDGTATNSYYVTFLANEAVDRLLFNATTNDANWVLNGSTWHVNTSFIVNEGSSATATGFFRNGTINVSNAGGTATFQVGDYASAGYGMFTMRKQAVGDAPTLIVDKFLLSSNALFTLEAGTLTTQDGSTLDGGTNAIVAAFLGSGSTNTATWNMLGGSNTVTSLTNGVTALGYNPSGDTVFNMNVFGPTTVWNIGGGRLGVGWNASANLVISNGAVVNSPTAMLSANGTTTSNNSVIVTGTGSQWNIASSGSLTVGNDAANNTLTIANGGVVNAGTLCYVGSGSGPASSNNTVVVTGADSQLLLNSGTSTIKVGNSTANNSLIISNGAGVSAAVVYVGTSGGGSNSMNNTLLLTGNGSTLSVLGQYDNTRVGNWGPGNTMIVSSGAVFNCFGLRMGDETNACYNTLIVDGGTVTSGWPSFPVPVGGLFNIGGNGSNNTVIITNGGQATCWSTSARMANNNPSSRNNSIVIDGANSAFNAYGGYVVGNAGGNNSVTVRNGGVWNTGSIDWSLTAGYTVGVGNNLTLTCNGNSITVTGPGSRWINWANVNFGNSSSNSLVVTNGGAVWCMAPTNFITAGTGLGSSNAVADGIYVAGAGSYFTLNGELRVGQFGGSHLMRISDGGVVSNTAGMASNSSSNTIVEVTGAGSLWYNSTGLRVGNGNSTNSTLRITNGGRVVNVGTITSISGGSLSFHNAILIDGTNSLLDCSVPSITVGSQGPSNTLTIQNGGRLNTAGGQSDIGLNAVTSNNMAIVTGPGSLWVSGGGLSVGTLGSYNQLIITNGGEAQVFGGMTMSYAATNLVVGSNNSALVVGGTLAVTNATDSSVLAVGKSGVTGGLATFTFSGGTMYVDQLILTNGALSVFTFNSGVLNVLSSQVAKASAFVVGDGINTAQLNLWSKPTAVSGTSHTFADGLTIANHGILSGVGTIVGNVSLANGATWAPGSSAGTQTVVGAVSLNPSTILNYELGAPGAPGDQVNITGNLTLDGTLNVSNLGGFGVGDYTLMTYTGSLTDNGLAIGSMPVGGLTYSIIAGGGSVVLHVTSGAVNPWSNWQTHYFPGGGPNAAGGADPDGDGMSNTNEFLAGFNPTSGTAYLHIISVARINGDVQVTYLGANGDTTYTGGPSSRTNVLEYTTGTANGSYSNNFVSAGLTNILSGGTGAGVVTNMVDSGGATNKPSRFYRVRVLLP